MTSRHTSHSPLYAIAAFIAVGAMLTGCAGSDSGGDSTVETTTTEPVVETTTETSEPSATVQIPTELPTGEETPPPGAPAPTDDGSATVEIPKPELPTP